MMKIFLKIYVNQQDIILQSQKLQMFRRYQSSQMKEVNLSQASQRSVSNIHEFSNPSRNDHEDQQKSQVIISFKFNSKNKNNQIIQIRRIKKIILTVIFLCVLLIGLLVSIKQTPSSQIINIPQVTQPQVTSPSPSSSSVIGEKHPNNRPNEDLKCSRFYDLNRKLTRNQTALSIQNYLCSGLDYVFDRYSEAQGKLYKMTNYKILLKTCGGSNQQSPTNDNVQKWNKDRLIAEWSLRKIKQNDKVLLVKSNKYNLLQIMLISHLVGAQGSLTVVSERGINGCLQQNMNMYNLNNINFQRINSVNFLKGYNVIISQLQAPEIKNAFSRLIQQSPEKSILLYLADHTQYSRVAAKMQINLFQVRDDLCSEPIISLPTQKQGYFSFSKKSQEDNLPLKKMDYTNSNVKQFVNEYNELMATRKSVVNKRIKQIQFIHSQCFCLTKQNRKYDGYTVSVYGSRLKGATQQEVDRWESEREPIEWTREKVKPNSAVYYEVRKLNLLTVTEISRIIAPAKLFVQCEQTDCTRIQKQKQFQSLNNIQIVVSSVDEALKANVIITDNEQIIDKAIAAEFLQKGQMLAYFTRERQTSFKVFAKILPNNRITQIEAYSQECMGYHQKHYFWDIDKMGQFYEIVPSNEYRIFTYWNGSPKILTPNRRQSLKQFIDSAMVQLKIFNQQTFLLVEGLMPIHEAFKYMQPGHQSDYLRVFMIHSFGGAWADVKHHHYDWRPYFKKLYDDPTKLALGYHQKAANHVGCHQEHGPPACSVIYANYRDYIGNGEFIYKKNTVLTQQIAARVTKTLDTKLEAIKANPPRIVRDYFGRQDQYGISKYPLRWAEVFGQYTARVAYDHPGVYLYDLPYVLMIDYI